ncbi:3'(2'),5'-bisphosphate nucleotidase CysQ [Mesobaculum littorinae]|uniref:3'(2'),5'-bisphosphate nucleotidase CysQ n=1 Tax=Mesobaculum littorinae TaxID=2486419 RepID=A0A438AHG5_9RHOB|nr:3'(2'),5'-bisphosphate nucleotidase CysQ [Mesobaculum littorinae]RVV98065.1 3'(2'),5'-bisphosphate nucleotidase CysQ [Mesobaculum littorinae]
MPATDLALLIDAARAAGAIALGHWRQQPKTWSKSDDTPVTEADLAVDRALHATLTAARPGYAWLSEESPDAPDRAAHERAFIVDPIDGTRSFAAGDEIWAHSLAVCEGGQITAAVVYLPVSDRLYAAARGQGATLNGTRLRVSARAGVAGASLAASRPVLNDRHWQGRAPAFDRRFHPALSFRMCLVAEGQVDAMLSFRETWEWDIAAGALLIAEAGGTVTDSRGGVLQFNSLSRQSRGILGAGPALHGDILACTAPG